MWFSGMAERPVGGAKPEMQEAAPPSLVLPLFHVLSLFLIFYFFVVWSGVEKKLQKRSIRLPSYMTGLVDAYLKFKGQVKGP